jgi:hypothetical protein
MRPALSLLFLAACSGASSSSSAPAVSDHRGAQPVALAHDRHAHAVLPPVGGIVEQPVPACPPEADLAWRLRELWQVPPDAKVDVAGCARGHFGRAGWLVDAFIDSGDEESEERIEVLAVDGSGVIAMLEPDGVRTADRFDVGAGDGWEAADLDGDGVDELLQLEERFDVGVHSTVLAVFRIEAAAIREVGRLHIAFDNRGAKAITAPRIVSCSGQHALADGGNGARHIVVEGAIARSGRQASGTANSSCPLRGPHRYRLVDGKLEEVTP